MSASDYQYWLGKETADLKYVGKRGIIRRDADDKATGKGKFGSDILLPGMLYARMLVCPYPRARIKSMDTSEAEKLPGVRAILRYDDPLVPQRLYNPWDPDVRACFIVNNACEPVHILGDEVRYEGCPVGVAVAADDLDICDEALDLVKIEWEQLPFVIDYEKALEPGAPIVNDHIDSYDPKNMYAFRIPMSVNYTTEEVTYSPGWEGKANANNIKVETHFKLRGTDLDKGFAEADNTLEFSFKRTEVIGRGPETLSSVVQWTDNGQLELWQAGENLVVTSIYALMLGIDISKFIVHQPYAGGQFGGWDCGMGNQTKQIPVAALLAKKTGTPIKIVYHCKDDQYAEMDEATCDVKVGYKQDGTITAVQMFVKAANMLDMAFLPETCGGGHFIESTKIPNIQGVATTVFVNKHNYGPSRCEQQINAHIKQQVFTRVASALGVDEGTIAIKNDGLEGIPIAEMDDYKRINKVPVVDSYGEVLPLAKQMIGFDDKFHAPGARSLPNGKYHGMCTSPNHEFSNGGKISSRTFQSAALINLSVDKGKVFLSALRPDCGLDGRTGYSRIVAEEMGMKLEDVIYPRSEEGSSHQPPTVLDGGGGSVVFTMQSWSFVAAARVLKKKILAVAAGLVQKDAAEIDILDSNIVLKSDSSIVAPISSLSSALQGVSCLNTEGSAESLDLPAEPTDGGHMLSRCVNILEVEVDTETGQVDLINAVCVNDVGMPIGPETVEGQMYGGAIMGYSTGAIEEQIYDPATGRRLTPNWLDYRIHTILDAPPIDYKMVTSRMGWGPYGSAGVGEDNCTFGSAMVSAAVFNAIGKWVDYPPTPERVLKALGKA